MLWLIFKYKPVSLFRLRPSRTTDAGVQTLLIPSFYAVRTAFMAQAFTLGGEPRAKGAFDIIKRLEIKLSPPNRAVLSTLAWRGIRWSDRVKEQKTALGGFGYREYVAYQGNFRVALNVKNLNSDEVDLLKILGQMVNYFGKANSFFQCVSISIEDNLGEGFCRRWSVEEMRSGVLTELDDWNEDITYEMVDVTYESVPKLDGQRVVISTVLPYRLHYGLGGVPYYAWEGDFVDAF